MTITQAIVAAGRECQKAPIVCGYYNGTRTCTKLGVSGTQGGWCSEDGLAVELHALEQDRRAAPADRMTADERAFALEEIARYREAM